MPYPRSALHVSLMVLCAALAGWLGGLLAQPVSASDSDPALGVDIDPVVPAPADEHAPPAPALSGRSEESDLADRVALLEAQLAKQAEAQPALEPQPEEPLDGPAARIAKARREIEKALGRSLVRNPDDARRLLALTDEQLSEFNTQLERARTEWSTVMDLPNDAGETWRELARVDLKSDGIVGLAKGVERLTRFKQSAIPGRNESYADAQERIVADLRRGVQDVLTEEQVDAWQGAQITGLLGSGIQIGTTTATNSDR